jgi:phosphoribosylformylglycinamidine synthase
LGAITDKIGGSELAFAFSPSRASGSNAAEGKACFELPTVDTDQAVDRYRTMYQAHQADLFTSIQHVGRGGIGITLAKSCIAGQIGASIMRPFSMAELFAEGKSCFVVSIAPDKVQEFEKIFRQATQIGVVTDSGELSVNGEKISLQDMSTWYKSPFKGY